LSIANHQIEYSVSEQQARCGDAGCTRAVNHHAQAFFGLAGKFERIDKRRQNHNSGAVLIVVHHRNVESFA
jgi:hypothetical protein